MAKAEINGTTLDYVEQGVGEPVVFVHGSASDRRTWQAQLDEFGQRYRAIAYSRRYHWPNDGIPAGADYSMLEHVDDLRSFLRSLDVVPVHLVGQSYGAFLALLLAMREPGLVRKLVLAEPPVLPLFVSDPPKPSEILGLLLTRPRTAVAILKFGATGIGPATKAARRGDMETAMRVFGNAVLGPDFYGRLPNARLEQVRANWIGAELLGSGFVSLGDDDVRGVRVPTLLVSGQSSPKLFHRITERLEGLLPHHETVEVRGASHNVHEDAPAVYNEAVLSFLSERSASVRET